MNTQSTDRKVTDFITKIAPIKLKEDFKLERQSERIVEKTERKWQKINKNGIFPIEIFYHSSKQAQQFSLKFDDGIFSNQRGKLVAGRYLYVVNEHYQIIARKPQEGLHHSHLANGKKVKGAGFMEFDQGRLVHLDDDSGHYQPTLKEMLPFLYHIYGKLSYAHDVNYTEYMDVAQKSLHRYGLSTLIEHVIEYQLEGIEEKGEFIENSSSFKSANTPKIQERHRFVKHYSDSFQHDMKRQKEGKHVKTESHYIYALNKSN
jgi:hypothetical protein